MNKYLVGTSILIKSGQIGELTITLSSLLGGGGGGGEISIKNPKIQLESTSEAGLVFHDVVESSIHGGLDNSLHELADSLASDLDIAEFTDEYYEGEEQSGIDLLESALSSMINSFNVTLSEMNVTLGGPQTFQKINFRIPTVKMGQEGGIFSAKTTGDISCELIVHDKIHQLLSTSKPASLVMDFEEGIPKLLLSAKDIILDLPVWIVSILKEFKRIYHGSRSEKRESIFDIEIELSETVLRLSADGDSLSIAMTSINCSSTPVGFNCVAKDLNIQGSVVMNSRSITFSRGTNSKAGLKISNLDIKREISTDIFCAYQNSLGLGVEKIASDSGSEGISCGVEEVTFDSVVIFDKIISGRLVGVEMSLDLRQIALHSSSASILFDSSSFEFSRMSIYRSQRKAIRQEPPCTRPSMVTVVEGQPFKSTLSNPEEYFLMRAALIECVDEHWHFSVDRVDISFNLSQLINLQRVVTTDWNTMRSGTKRCLSLSIHQLKVQEIGTGLGMEAVAIEGLATSGLVTEIHDIRMDPIDVSITCNDEKLSMFQKTLTISLDPHFKPLIMTFTHNGSGIEDNLLVNISGGNVSLPLYSEAFDQTLQIFQNAFHGSNSSNSSTLPLVYFQMQRCSFRTILSSKHQSQMAPHVLYLDNARVILNTTETSPVYCFLQNGELFLAPGPGLVLPATGLFDEGHNYWEEQNYEAVASFDFLPLQLQNSGGWLVRVEGNLVALDIHRDSMAILLECLNLYLLLLREQRLLVAGKCTKCSLHKDTLTKDSDSELVSELSCLGFSETDGMFKLEETPVVQSLDLDADFYAMPVLSSDEPVDIEEETYGMIELPLPPGEYYKDDDVKMKFASRENVDENSSSERISLDIEDDFFAKKTPTEQAFPFTNTDGVPLRIQIADFACSIRLHAGRKFHPDRSTHVTRTSLEREWQMTSSLTETASRTKSNLSSSASSKWSHLMGGSRRTATPTHDSVEVVLKGLNAELDCTDPFPAGTETPGNMLTTIRLSIKQLHVVDHVRASRWKSFLTRRTIKGDPGTRPMVQVRLNTYFVAREGTILPEDQLESSVKLDVEPLRLHVDQDTLLFILSFLDGGFELKGPSTETSLFLQRFHLSELSIRLDYKPKHLDFRKAVGGQYVELLNLFHLEEAELHLPPVTLTGVSGATELVSQLLRAWLPFIRNTQVPQVMSGITPVRTMLNLSSGVTDLILLPIEQYKRKNGRVIHGLRRGTASFLHAAALEAARLGKKLAVGTQTLLEQADDLIQNDPLSNNKAKSATSKYSAPPADAAEGLLAAYNVLSGSMQNAVQTVIAIPVQVYERQGPGGAAKAVLRAMPVAVLRSMVGASEAMGKALMGVEGTLNPDRGAEIKLKYKDEEFEEDDYTISPLPK